VPFRKDMDRRHFLGLSAFSVLLSGCGGDESPAVTSQTDIVTPDAPVASVLAESDWQLLADNLSGDIILPTHGQDYELARLVFNSRYDHIYPQVIAQCHNDDDVAFVLGFAQQHNLAITPRCGSHSYAGTSTTEGMVIDVTPMADIDISGNTVTIGAGARLVDVYDTLERSGLGIPLGSCLSVGISGLTQGGGFSILDRAYGLTCDSLTSLEVVTAQGDKLTCNESQNADLFWALRGGGGGNFAVVTAFTFNTHKTSDIHVFEAYFYFDAFEEVMTKWQELSDYWPSTMWGQIIPNWSNGGAPSVYVRAFCVNSKEEADSYWQQFITSLIAIPQSNNNTTDSYRNVMLGTCSNTIAACHLSTQFPDGGMSRSAFAASSDFFEQIIPPIAITTLKNYILQSLEQGNLGMIIINLMGGAIAEKLPDSTAFPHRNAIFNAQYYTAFTTRTANTVVDSAQVWENSFREVMKPWSSGGAYINYQDALLDNWQQAYYGDNYYKLTQIKSRYDPNSVFNQKQAVEPA